MVLNWLCIGFLLPFVIADPYISDDLYFRAPPLFHIEDYDRCLFEGGSYCMGDFELRAEGPNELYDELIKASSNRYLLNRTRLHRGVCVTWCGVEDDEPAKQLEYCVDKDMQENYGLRASLQSLQYCKSKAKLGTRPIDFTDILMAAVIVFIIVLNVVGTTYDLMRNPNNKPNRFLMAWSLRVNWNRLTAYNRGDEKLDALAPIHGIKTHQCILVIMAHTLLAISMVYQQDPRKLDDIMTNPGSVIVRNGTIIVQSFAMISNFLFAYMMLLHVEKTKKQFTFKNAFAIFLNRYMRMTPTIMFVVGVTATWVARTADGPMWTFMEQLESECRAKWWTHLLYINNLVNPDRKCLIQTWFLAIEMQVFVVALILMLFLLPYPRRAVKVLFGIYVAVLAVNLALNIKWKMVPMIYINTAENVRNLYVGIDSYNWMFSMPWISLPACLHGLILAFLHYNLDKAGFKPAEYKSLRVIAWMMFFIKLAWTCSGNLFMDVTDSLVLSVVATFDRTIFNALVALTLWLYINKLSGWVSKYLSWRGFQITSRIALSTALVHWHINLAGLAAQSQPLDSTKYNFMVLWFSGVVLTFLLAIPLHLMVEVPSQKVVDMLM